jgi:hypothetical protein
MHNRREFLKWSGLTLAATPVAQTFSALMNTGFQDKERAVRCINVVNFIRGVEPRFETDLLLPVQKQMECLLDLKLPATWLLQFDALVDPKFPGYLRAHMTPDHEVGFWFEMNEKLCRAAGVEWRGRPGFEWDHLPPVAFTIGYTPEERIRLADTAMREFKAIWGRHPASVASWNLDSITLAHLTEKYRVDAYAVCRDQIATDGFTIWGAPIAGYYPSKTNCWSPALSEANQIDTPIFRMLGQDPVHYYNNFYKLPDGRVVREPDTMEPVWTSGRSHRFVRNFLNMISREHCLKFAYAQLGQENSFPWRDMAQAFPEQMEALARLRKEGTVHVETMGDSGRRFKKAFRTTPTQAQIMRDDPFGIDDPAESSIWYQSRFYRADLHFRGDLPYFRDLTVYSDHNPQPFLKEATRLNDVEQRMPAVLDGFHWSRNPGAPGEIGAGGFFVVAGERLRVAGRPAVREDGDRLLVDLPIQGGRTLSLKFEEKGISVSLDSGGLALEFEWDPGKACAKEVRAQSVSYEWQGFEYHLKVEKGRATATPTGLVVNQGPGGIGLCLAQDS